MDDALQPSPFLQVSLAKQRHKHHRRREILKHILKKGRTNVSEVEVKELLGTNKTLPAITENDVIRSVSKVKMADLTDDEAVRLMAPCTVYGYLIQCMVERLVDMFCAAPQTCAWNKPEHRPEWQNDFRFLHEWWLSMRTIPYFENPKDYYPPLIPWGNLGTGSENQLFADVAMKLRETKLPAYLLHIDHIILSPERVSVLLFDGVFRGAFCRTETFSATFCSIGAATLLVILIALYYGGRIGQYVQNLHLAYNWIDSSCVNMLTILLPQTNVTRLSLRGNRFGGGDANLFQEFLVSGCMLLEELDIGYTSLDLQELCALIGSLPSMQHLRVLLMDGVNVPRKKAAALLHAIELSKLVRVSLKGIPACSSDSYLDRLEAICRSHRTGRDGAMPDWGKREVFSFLESFESKTSNWLNHAASGALPPDYRVFTTNDPSLMEMVNEKRAFLRLC
uniref:Uncharacterized protein TCIL3000_4_920 n=1 Tax=Trypanosoma congolense (strain IL3000) TaxID=1068625 RepID=G0UKV3_TRYCI|nr:unnamed protein product [Trypanosoma congolense IL3000]